MLLFFFFPWISGVFSQTSGQILEPFNPPSLPLIVKSPYVNFWLYQGSQSGQVNELWPHIWDEAAGNMGWNAGIRVDGRPYKLLGASGIANYTTASQKSGLFTPTRTSFLLTAGSVDVNMTLLSPIETHDLTRLSMSFTYLYLTATSNDNNTHEIQFYSDMTSDWFARGQPFLGDWSSENTSEFVSLRMQLASEGKYQEVQNTPQDIVLYHSMQKRSGLSWEINTVGDLRSAFVNGTGLQNRTDNNFNVVTGTTEGLGISVDIGTIQPGTESNPVVYTIGVVRDPVIQYTNGNNKLEELRAYYWANFTSINDVVKDALDHFDDALAASIELDNKLLAAANSISTEYAGLISLVTRQAMSTIEYTINIDDNDNNISDIKAFIKNTGNVGSEQANTVDVIYSAMPIYLYLNPEIIGYLLSPLLDAQSSSQYTNKYAAIGLGGKFPNATGNPQGHNEGIEQSANMIILSLVHAQASGNGNLINKYYDLLSKWGDYLLDNTLSPADQTTSSSDNIGRTNQTNLVLKGIIGIRAMSQISFLTGHSDDATKYKTKADQYYQSWENLAIVSNRIVLTYGGSDSGLIYNLYADKLLGLNVVNDSVYALQTSFYGTHLSQQKYGVSLDATNSSLSRTDWMLFAASATTDTQVRDNMIHQVYTYATSNSDNKPFPLIYNPSSGKTVTGINSPAQGAIFAPLALTVNKSTVILPPDSNSKEEAIERHPSTGAVVGGVVGGVAVIAIFIACFILYRRRQRKEEVSEDSQSTGYNGNRELPIPWFNSSHGFTNSNTELSSPELGDMSQVSRNRDHSDIVPIPLRPPASSSSSTMQDSTPKNKAANPKSASQGTIEPRSNAESSADTRQSSPGGEAWREEVNNLRMEIERLREESAPPSYQS